jgi:hypothetical protein
LLGALKRDGRGALVFAAEAVEEQFIPLEEVVRK